VLLALVSQRPAPDPAALALLLGALSSGKSCSPGHCRGVQLGFAATLVVVGIVAAKVGEKCSTGWQHLDDPPADRHSLLIVGMAWC